jgi:hypothetical protein
MIRFPDNTITVIARFMRAIHSSTNRVLAEERWVTRTTAKAAMFLNRRLRARGRVTTTGVF